MSGENGYDTACNSGTVVGYGKCAADSVYGSTGNVNAIVADRVDPVGASR